MYDCEFDPFSLSTERSANSDPTFSNNESTFSPSTNIDLSECTTMNRDPVLNPDNEASSSTVGLMQPLSEPHHEEIQTDLRSKSRENKDTFSIFNSDQFVACNNCVYTTVSLKDMGSITQRRSANSHDNQTAIVNNISQTRSADSHDSQTTIINNFSHPTSANSCDSHTAILNNVSQPRSANSCDSQTVIVNVSQPTSADSCDSQTAIVNNISQPRSAKSYDSQTVIINNISQPRSAISCDNQTGPAASYDSQTDIISNISQPRSAGSCDSQADNICDYSNCSASMILAQTQVTSTTHAAPLISPGLQELNQSEQDALPQEYQLITLDGVQYIPVSSLSMSSLPLDEVNVAVLGTDTDCQDVMMTSSGSVNQLDIRPMGGTYSQNLVLSNVSFSQLDTVPSTNPLSSQHGFASIASFSEQVKVQSNITFPPQNPVRQVPILESVSSMCSSAAVGDVLSYSYITGTSEQGEGVPSEELQNVQVTLIEPSASTSSSENVLSADDSTMYLNVTNLDSMYQNFDFSVCENANVSCPNTTIIESTCHNPTVFMGSTSLDNSFPELMSRSDNPELEYFDICRFVSSPQTSPMKKRNCDNKLTIDSTVSSATHTTDVELLLSKMKSDNSNVLMPQNIVSPSTTKMFISPDVEAGKSQVIAIKKTKPRLAAVKPGSENCRYVKPTSTFLNKMNVKMIDNLKPFCKCVEESDQSLVLKEQTVFAYGQQVLLPQICRVACCGFELIVISRGCTMFMCTSQLLSFNLIDKEFYNNVQKCHPDHIGSMTRDEIQFVQHHTGMTKCHGLISLKLVAAALNDLPAERKQAMGNDLTFYRIRPGHSCDKRKQLIRSVPDVERVTNETVYKSPELNNSSAKKATELPKYLSKAQRKKYTKKEAELNSKLFVVNRPDGKGSCLAEVKKVLVADKELMSFYCLDNTYINCLQLCQYLANFPWDSFMELAKSLNIDFIDAPTEVQMYFKRRGFCKDIVSGKWTSITNLRLISCFTVGQMNHTDFLIKNSVLTKIAKGDYREVSEKPVDVSKSTASEIQDSVSAKMNDPSECKSQKVVAVKKSFNNKFHAVGANQPSSQTTKMKSRQPKKRQKKTLSSQISSSVQLSSPVLQSCDMSLNNSGEKINGTSACVKKADCLKTTDYNDNMVIVQTDEGSLLECTPLYLKNSPQVADSNNVPCTPQKSVFSAEVNRENSVPLLPITGDQSLTSLKTGLYHRQLSGSPGVDSSSAHVSQGLDLLIRTPQPVTETSDGESLDKGKLISQTSDEDLTSPDSGISLNVKSGNSPAVSKHLHENVERWMSKVACQTTLVSVGLEPVEQNSILRQPPKTVIQHSSASTSQRNSAKISSLEAVVLKERIGKCCQKGDQSEMELNPYTQTTAENLADEEKSKQQDFSNIKCKDLTTVFKQLLPMISVTDVVSNQSQLKFCLRLGQPIKQMLTINGQSMANVHRFLKIIGRLVQHAHQYVSLVPAKCETFDVDGCMSDQGNLQHSDILHSCPRDIGTPVQGSAATCVTVNQPQQSTANKLLVPGFRPAPSQCQIMKEARRIAEISSVGNDQLFPEGRTTLVEGRRSPTTNEQRTGLVTQPQAAALHSTSTVDHMQHSGAKCLQHSILGSPTSSTSHTWSVKDNYPLHSISVNNVRTKQRINRTRVADSGDSSENAELKNQKPCNKKQRAKFKKRSRNKTNSLYVPLGRNETVPQNPVIKRKRGRPRKNTTVTQSTEPTTNSAARIHGRDLRAEGSSVDISRDTHVVSLVSDFVTYPDPHSSTAPADGAQATDWSFSGQVFIPPAVRQQCTNNNNGLAGIQSEDETNTVFTDMRSDQRIDLSEVTGHWLSSTADPYNTYTKQKRKDLEEKCTEESIVKRRKF